MMKTIIGMGLPWTYRGQNASCQGYILSGVRSNNIIIMLKNISEGNFILMRRITNDDLPT